MGLIADLRMAGGDRIRGGWFRRCPAAPAHLDVHGRCQGRGPDPDRGSIAWEPFAGRIRLARDPLASGSRLQCRSGPGERRRRSDFCRSATTLIPRLIGTFLLIVVVLRHTTLGQRKVPDVLLAPAGAGVGFLSSVAGSAGPLGAAVFLSLHLPPRAYVASEAVTAVLMHLTKSIIYGRYAALTAGDLLSGPRPGRLAGGRLMDGSKADRSAAGEGICSAGRNSAGGLRRNSRHPMMMRKPALKKSSRPSVIRTGGR